MLQPVEGGAHVFDLADAVGVLAFAQSGAAEVEAQHRESEAVERFHGVEDDFVVQRSAEEWMRMTDERSVSRGGRSRVEQGFEASGGAFEEEERMRRILGSRCRWSCVVGRSGSSISIAENQSASDYRLTLTSAWQQLATSDQRLLRFSCHGFVSR